uniref:Uncharacterized protein n=1 Tax=Daphnia magna TaxID=35525 RepID=A0A0N8ELJ7_9CRUS
MVSCCCCRRRFYLIRHKQLLPLNGNGEPLLFGLVLFFNTSPSKGERERGRRCSKL